MEADRIEQGQGEKFDMEFQMALQRIEESCLCPDPVGAFDPSAARDDLDRLQPMNDPNSDAAKAYREASSAFSRGTATPDQRALIIHTERIKGAFGALQDHPRT